MGFSEIENAEQKLTMNSSAAENGENYGVISNGRTNQASRFISPKLFLHGLWNKLPIILVLLVILTISISITIITSFGRSHKELPPALPPPSTPTECCPDRWIGYQRKCYYFSDSDRNWTYSQNYCASFNASLVMIDSQEEMIFLRRYKGPADHWIGLQRMNVQEPWRWIDGSIFNNWFEILGGGEYAYINHQGIASSSIRSEEPWICSKPVYK